MAHLYYLRACLGAPDSTARLVYRYVLSKGDTAVGYTISRYKDQVRFFDNKPAALAAMLRVTTKGPWEVAIYKPRITPGLERVSKPYTTRVRQVAGVATMAVEILRANGKKVLATVVERAFQEIIVSQKETYAKRKAALLKEIENGRPD